MNAVDMDVASATIPINEVPTAPPMGVIIRKEEAIFTFFPASLMVIAKIVGNIIASNA